MTDPISHALALAHAARRGRDDGGPVSDDMPQGAGGDGFVMQPYEPTWRDRIGAMLMGDGQASPERRNFVSGLVGSTGLGNTGMSAADLTPVGGVLGLQEDAQHHDPVGMALNAVSLIPGAAVAKVAEKAAPAAADLAKGIIAYHGSPHSFDKFDLSKIGTGEGAQAYGHGLYFAGNEDVARSYRSRLSAPWDSYVDGQRAREMDKSTWEMADTLASRGMTPDQYISDIQAKSASARAAGNEARAAALEDILNESMPTLDALRGREITKGPAGSMYQVRINADPAHFLDWDKPLSEQPKVVQDAYNAQVAPGLKVREIGNNPNFGPMYDVIHPSGGSIGTFTQDTLPDVLANPAKYVPTRGNDFWKNLVEQAPITGAHGSAEDFAAAYPWASNTLNQAGIPGIKYLDAGSRAAGDGSRNYVVFHPDIIDILRRYARGGDVNEIARSVLAHT